MTFNFLGRNLSLEYIDACLQAFDLTLMKAFFFSKGIPFLPEGITLVLAQPVVHVRILKPLLQLPDLRLELGVMAGAIVDRDLLLLIHCTDVDMVGQYGMAPLLHHVLQLVQLQLHCHGSLVQLSHLILESDGIAILAAPTSGLCVAVLLILDVAHPDAMLVAVILPAPSGNRWTS